MLMVDHCPWLGNNCVGFYNQGHFIRFLLWVDIATSYHLLMMLARCFAMAGTYAVGALSNPTGQLEDHC